MDTPKTLAARLRDYAEDPMWAEHAEVPKSLLREAVDLLSAPDVGAGRWRPISEAPEDEYIILATMGGWVGEAMMLRDEDTGGQKWTWALGPVHPQHVPLGWMPLPTPIDQPVEAM